MRVWCVGMGGWVCGGVTTQIILRTLQDLRWQQFSFKICFALRIASFYVLLLVLWPRILIYFGTQWYRTGHRAPGTGNWECPREMCEQWGGQTSAKKMKAARDDWLWGKRQSKGEWMWTNAEMKIKCKWMARWKNRELKTIVVNLRVEKCIRN